MSEIKIPNILINAKPPGFSAKQNHIADEIMEAIDKLDRSKLKDPEHLHMSGRQNYVKSGKQIIVGILYKNLLKKGDRNYSWIKQAAHGMKNKPFILDDSTSLSFVERVQCYAYDKKTGRSKGTPGVIELGISYEAVEYFSCVSDFTPRSKSSFDIHGKYTMIMLNLIRQFSHDGYSDRRTFLMDDLRLKLGVGEKHAGWKEFRIKVLEPCQAELEGKPEAFYWDIDRAGYKGGANGNQVLKIDICLKHSLKKQSNLKPSDGSVSSHMKVFWKKHEPATPGGLFLAGPLWEAYNLLKERLISIMGKEGELFRSKYSLTDAQTKLLLKYLTPQQLYDGITAYESTKPKESLAVYLASLYPALYTDMLHTRYHLSDDFIRHIVTSCTGVEIEQAMEEIDASARKAKKDGKKIGKPGGYSRVVFENHFPEKFLAFRQKSAA